MFSASKSLQKLCDPFLFVNSLKLDYTEYYSPRPPTRITGMIRMFSSLVLLHFSLVLLAVHLVFPPSLSRLSLLRCGVGKTDFLLCELALGIIVWWEYCIQLFSRVSVC